jgi:hypothetical protein
MRDHARASSSVAETGCFGSSFHLSRNSGCRAVIGWISWQIRRCQNGSFEGVKELCALETTLLQPWLLVDKKCRRCVLKLWESIVCRVSRCNRSRDTRASKRPAKSVRFAKQLPRRDGRVVDGGGLENVSGSVIPRRLYFRGQLHSHMRKMWPDFARSSRPSSQP